MELAVGCPVRDRAWILPAWFEHVEAACERAGIEPRYLFVADPWNDADTVKACGIGAAERNRSIEVDVVDEGDRGPYRREWHRSRLAEMVVVRDRLLALARSYEPDLFWSLDSDILTHPDSLVSALEGIGRFDAVGMKAFMSPGTSCPSYAMLRGESWHRPNQDGFFPVDVIMASKLMTPKAYYVNYAYDDRGEDIGWSKCARVAGVKLGWDGRVCSKHVMRPWNLDVLDERCGY